MKAFRTWNQANPFLLPGVKQRNNATNQFPIKCEQLVKFTDGTFRAELERLMADDDGRVVGFQRSTGDRNGNHLDVGNCIVFTLEDGRVIDGREHFEDLYAWDQFWS
jgi:ketosteroid isomerase-like protein